MNLFEVQFAPDIDSGWQVAPGTVTALQSFAPMQLGSYGTMGEANYYGSGTLTGTDIRSAYLFRQVNGTVRFLVFRKSDIDEYTSANTTPTNRATGLTASSSWRAAAWGNQIIAVSAESATQSSTGTSFSALSGSPPKAKFIASNVNFVMLGSVNDGSSYNYPDAVWWCALRNPAYWTPSIAYQCGRIRLLDAPGPITALVAYQDKFIAFKNDAVFVGEYIGQSSSFIFRWTMISSQIGCIAPDSVKELDGKLYWLHAGGFFCYDGEKITNVGLPINQTFLSESGYCSIYGRATIANATLDDISTVKAVADDVEGVVWWAIGYTLSSNKGTLMYGYNARSGKWGRKLVATVDTNSSRVFVNGRYSDIQAFKSDPYARCLMLEGIGANATLYSVRYPYAATASTSEKPSFTTGMIGSQEKSRMFGRLFWRSLPGTDQDTGIAITATGYTTENKNVSYTSTTGAINTELDCGDFTVHSRFTEVTATTSTAKKMILQSIGIDTTQSNR